MSVLFSPINLRSLTLPNRIVVSPMCQYVAEEGGATAWHLIHLGSMALSGAGLLCIEATAVEAERRITAGDCYNMQSVVDVDSGLIIHHDVMTIRNLISARLSYPLRRSGDVACGP